METDAEKSVFRHGGARRATAEELAFIKKKLIPDARASVAIGITLSVMLLCIIAWFVYGILRQKGIWLIVLSLAVPSALEKGVDAFSLGYKYNFTAISEVGFATAVDSLLAVKELKG